MSDGAEYFAPSRLFTTLGCRLIEPLAGIDLGIEAWAQFDLEAAGVPTHTQYVEPYLEGRSGRSFRWRAWYIFESGMDPDFFMSMATGGRGRWSFPDMAGLRLTASAFWAGASTDALRPFTPLSASLLGSIAPQTFSDVTVGSLDVSLAPTSWANLGMSLAAFFRGDFSVASPYMGFEAALRLALKPVSDFNVDLGGGLYSPFEEGSPLKWQATLMATAKF